MNDLKIPKGKVVQRPLREPDLISKRGIYYWFAPEWCRDLNGTMTRVRIIKRPNSDDVELFMVSKDGVATFIQGSIQKEFKKWCYNRQIDALLLGVNIEDMLAADWTYVDPSEQNTVD